jgi:hypothetical protein
MAGDGLVDQTHDRRTGEGGRAFNANEAHLFGGPLQQFVRIRQFLARVKYSATPSRSQ